MRNAIALLLCLCLPFRALAQDAGTPELTKDQMLALLRELDDRQRNGGDYKALAYLEQKEKDKADVVREVMIFRRDSDDKLMLLFTKPKSEEGKGYLPRQEPLELRPGHRQVGARHRA